MGFLLNVLVLAGLMITDVEGVNRAVDRLVPLYLVLAVLGVALYQTRQGKQSENGVDESLRTYSYKKKPKFDPANWRARHFGKWDKITRTNFQEFLVFNGAPSFVASLNKDAALQVETLDVDGDNKRVQFNLYGVPQNLGVPIPIGDAEETAVDVAGIDSKRGDYLAKVWWSEADKTLVARISFKSGWRVDATRRVDDDDVLHFKNTITKPDGSHCSFEATLKRIA